MAVKRLTELDFKALTRRPFTPSPAAWEDQVLYFLMLDRFSDGQENGYRDNQGNMVDTGNTPLFQSADAGNAINSEVDAARWRTAGGRWVGGTLKGLESKIGYLKRLGVTCGGGSWSGFSERLPRLCSPPDGLGSEAERRGSDRKRTRSHTNGGQVRTANNRH